VGDVLFELDGKSVDTPETLISYLAVRKPGDSVAAKVIRGPEKLDLSVTLTKRPPDLPSGGTLPLIVSGEVSRMSGPFQRVFQHDAVLRPDAIGGPLFDLNGKCVGMNIARADRTSTYAIEPRDVREIYARLKAQAKP
jgi:serine protease Do